MKYKILQVVILSTMVILLFLPIFNVEGQGISGFSAIFSSEILLFGNIIIGFIVILTSVHFIYAVLSLFIQHEKESYKNLLNAIVSLNSIFGLLLVTFTGLILGWIGLVFVGLMIVSAFVRYKFIA